MKNKSDSMQELIEEICDGERTNYQMYKEATLLHEKKKELEYDKINEIFDLEKRTKLDLLNLREFIICITLMCGQDVLKARGRNSLKLEKIEQHEKRCDLMTLISRAIDGALWVFD